MLNSLRIENFRAFRSLSVGQLGAVNLIVGRNNVGKTVLLEALELYASPDPFDTVQTILIGRDEVASEGGERDVGDMQVQLSALFYGRPLDLIRAPAVRIGPLSPLLGADTERQLLADSTLGIAVRPYRTHGDELEVLTTDENRGR